MDPGTDIGSIGATIGDPETLNSIEKLTQLFYRSNEQEMIYRMHELASSVTAELFYPKLMLSPMVDGKSTLQVLISSRWTEPIRVPANKFQVTLRTVTDGNRVLPNVTDPTNPFLYLFKSYDRNVDYELDIKMIIQAEIRDDQPALPDVIRSISGCPLKIHCVRS